MAMKLNSKRLTKLIKLLVTKKNENNMINSDQLLISKADLAAAQIGKTS